VLAAGGFAEAGVSGGGVLERNQPGSRATAVAEGETVGESDEHVAQVGDTPLAEEKLSLGLATLALGHRSAAINTRNSSRQSGQSR
jgi:hypothetical protein